MGLIHTQPNSFDSFLEIFNLCNEDGDIFFEVEEYGDVKTEYSVKEVCQAYETTGWGLFSVSYAVPHLQEKINFAVQEEDGGKFAVMQLAPLLGLPGEDFKTELNELKDLLTWVREKGFAHPEQEFRLILDGVGEDASFELVGRDDEFVEQLNKEMFQKIDQSPILSKWVENQKIGIINAKGKLFDLCARMPVYALMDYKEQSEYFKSIPNKKESPKKKKNTIFKGFF